MNLKKLVRGFYSKVAQDTLFMEHFDWMTEVLQHPDNFTVDELRQRVEKDYEMQLQLKKQEASKRQDTGGFYTK